MPFIDDGRAPYSLGPNGEKKFATATNFEIDGDRLYQFDTETGILGLSANKETIRQLVEAYGGLPIKEMTVPTPFGEQLYAHDVKEIRSLPRKDGSFFFMTQANTAHEAGCADCSHEVTPPKLTWRQIITGFFGIKPR